MVLFLARCAGGASKGGSSAPGSLQKLQNERHTLLEKPTSVSRPKGALCHGPQSSRRGRRKDPPRGSEWANHAAHPAGSPACAKNPSDPKCCGRSAKLTLNLVEVALTPTCHLMYTIAPSRGRASQGIGSPPTENPGRRRDRVNSFRRRRATGDG